GAGAISTLFGGSNANQTFTLQSTNNGAPSGDSIALVASAVNFQAGFLGTGGGSFTANQNAAAITTWTAAVGTGFRIFGKDGAATGFQGVGFGGQIVNTFLRIDGTNSAPTTL